MVRLADIYALHGAACAFANASLERPSSSPKAFVKTTVLHHNRSVHIRGSGPSMKQAARYARAVDRTDTPSVPYHRLSEADKRRFAARRPNEALVLQTLSKTGKEIDGEFLRVLKTLNRVLFDVLPTTTPLPLRAPV